MPNIQSAKKALRQSARRRVHNLEKQRNYKEAVKSYRKFIGLKQRGEAATALTRAYQALDKAAKTNVITKSKASRLKSRLARKLPALA